ncbi:MAG: hypothetical protein ACR2RE_08345, partial [Geminicoccaceae bacterium]
MRDTPRYGMDDSRDLSKETSSPQSGHDAFATEIPIEVFLNGNREYIQGTQMLGRACALAPMIFQSALALCDASFTKITCRQIQIGTSLRKHDVKPVGRVVFRARATRLPLYFYERALPADRRVIPERCQYSLIKKGSPLEGRFLFSKVSTIDDLLIVVVQTIKILHEQLGRDIRNI